MNQSMLLLASKSKARQAMLKAAGISFEAIASNINESRLKDRFAEEGLTTGEIADGLAEAKAVQISSSHGQQLVLGGDQVLAFKDGQMLDKPTDRMEAKNHLVQMSGRSHQLLSAAVIVQNGIAIWRHIDVATMTMRNLSENFIDYYVEREWDNIRHCVGCYEIEGKGIQLFSRIEGSHFTIMGLPLLNLLDYLREQGAIPS